MPRLSPGREDNAERFDRFVRDCVPLLERFLGRLRVASDDVQDVAQESLARLLRYRDSEPPEAWTALLYRIAINVARDRARRDRHAPRGEASEPEILSAEAS